MADEQLRRVMQEVLDETATAEQQELLRERLQEDNEEARHWSNLLQVQTMLQNPPLERAPARLAMKIMARLAEEVKMQAEQNPDISALALTLGLALVTIVMMPILMAASWMVVNAIAGAEVLVNAIQEAVGLLVIMIDAVEMLLDAAQDVAETDPDTATQIAALVPMILLTFVEYLEQLVDPDNVNNAPAA